MKKKSKGLNILLNAYWSSKGWKDGTISKSDFEYSKKEGYMFEYPKFETHDNTLKKLNNLMPRINQIDVANAFLYSLSTRKLEYRSALGSYFFAVAIPKHQNKEFDYKCNLCGWYAWKKNPNQYDLNFGLNVFNFERYKWGGVRHTHLDYVLFDLEQFLKLPKVAPSEEDKKILNNILKCVNQLSPKDKVGKLRKIISKEKIFKSNKDEIDIILNILGICGILASEEFPTYYDKFVDEYHRAPAESKNDFAYPVNRWHASDGINYNNFEKVFGYQIKK